MTLVSAAIENAPGSASEAFLPVLRNGVTTEYHHVQALKQAGGKPLTTKYWFPDAALDNGGIGIFETIETIEISLYLIGVSAYVRLGEDFGARLCTEAMGTELSTGRSYASHKASSATKSARPTTSASRTLTIPGSARSAQHSKHSASATGSKPHIPAGSTNTPATRSPTASALRSITRNLAKRTTAQRALPGAPRKRPASTSASRT